MTISSNAIYDTNVLVQLVPNLKTSQNFLLDKFFPNIVTSDTEFVSIDVDLGKRRMAPFVSPLVAGKLVESRRFQTNIFKPAYIKDRRAPDLRKPVRRAMGEKIGGELSAADREQANLMFELTDQVDMLNRRLEWMAAQAMDSGTVTITGDGYPTTLVDFGRASSLTVNLGGAAQWTDAAIAGNTASPTTDLETWSLAVLKESGVVVTDVVMDTLAYRQFLKDPILKTAQWYPNQGGNNSVELGAQPTKGAVRKGTWGNLTIWVYADWFVDDNNVEQPMLANNTVLLSGAEMMGTRSFAAILDPEFGYGPMAYAPKSWVEKDPAQRFLLMQSSPIVIPSRANGCFRARVR
jgi:hypothetical protein